MADVIYAFFPQIPFQLRHQLRRIGYLKPSLPNPLVPEAANDVLGPCAARYASSNAPKDLGQAYVIAHGDYRGDHVVIRIPTYGDYRGSLMNDVFFVGGEFERAGRLYSAGDFYLFCPVHCTAARLKQALVEIQQFRERFY